MSPPALAVAPAPKPGKKKHQTEVEKLNAKALGIAAWALETATLFQDGVPTDLLGKPAGAPFIVLLTDANDAVALLQDAARKLSSALLPLHKAKWAPRHRARGEHRPGDLVALKEKRIARYEGAYSKEDLAHLRVVSVHGKLVKAEVFKDGLKGESVGLVSRDWLVARK
jgi:hypothetical protein